MIDSWRGPCYPNGPRAFKRATLFFVARRRAESRKGPLAGRTMSSGRAVRRLHVEADGRLGDEAQAVDLNEGGGHVPLEGLVRHHHDRDGPGSRPALLN